MWRLFSPNSAYTDRRAHKANLRGFQALSANDLACACPIFQTKKGHQMKHSIRLLSATGLALAAIIVLGPQAPPAHADYAYECMIHVEPEPVRRSASEPMPVTETFKQVSLTCEGSGKAQKVVLLTLASVVRSRCLPMAWSASVSMSRLKHSYSLYKKYVDENE